MKPYYQDDSVTIYNADCREVLPTLPQIDLVLTDPPYPKLDYGWDYVPIESLGLKCRGFYFWLLPPEPFPLPFTALHVWSKSNTYIGQCETWEPIYEVNGHKVASVMRYAVINCEMNAQLNGDVFLGHPTQKPIKLMLRLVTYASRPNDTILDPFLGSGTTAFATKKLNRKCIGIEISERYCEIAAKRCSQTVMDLTTGIEANTIQPMEKQP